MTTTGTRNDWAQRWPELLDGLTPAQVRAVSDAVANNVLEGWEPTRRELANLCDQAAGRISFDEYRRRSLAGE